MKLPCEMIRDLLPLYHDGVCSEISKTLVTEHLKDCPNCAAILRALDAEMQMPTLEGDEARPLKRIRQKFRMKTRRTGLLLGVLMFSVAIVTWFSLTQSSCVPIAPEDYTVKKIVRFENGMYYLEYSHPYVLHGICADIHRTDSGEIHIVEQRPRISRKQQDAVIRSYLIDPEQETLHSDTGKEVPFTAFYLGCPDEGAAVPLWREDMDIPMATPEEEQLYLYNQISHW